MHKRNITWTHRQNNLQQVGDSSSHQTIVRKALGHANNRRNM